MDAQATYADCCDIPNFQGSDEQKTAGPQHGVHIYVPFRV